MKAKQKVHQHMSSVVFKLLLWSFATMWMSSCERTEASGISCGAPPPVLNAKTRYHSTRFGSVVTYVCNPGFTLLGASKRICKVNGKWSGAGSTCLQVCTLPEIPISTYVAHPANYNRTYLTGEMISLACKKGYKRQPGGNPIRVCISGRWTQFPFECKEATTCGYSSINVAGKIVNGRKSLRGMWPWQIALYGKMHSGGLQFLCGGSLISRRWVLTAAHCFYGDAEFYGNASWYIIKAGAYNLTRDESSQQNIVPEKIVIHPQYDYVSSVDFDVALVRLSRKVRLTRFVRPVCLPEKHEGDLAVPGDDGNVAGWGVTRALRPGELGKLEDASKVLRDAVFTIQNKDLCKNQTNEPYNSTITFCAGDGKGETDSCQGDSGGPFVREIRRGSSLLWVVVGVVAWGEGCAQKDKYGYYTRLYPYLDWIKETLKEPIDCGVLRTPQRGEKILETHTRVGGVVRFKCKEGYEISGSEIRFCLSTGLWSGLTSSCRKIDCGVLPTPVMATKVLETGTKVDGVVRYACKEKGYEISGSEMRTCLSTGVWSGFTTSCKIISCGDSGTPVNGKQVNMKNDYNYGGSVEFACNDNYTLAGSPKIVCEESKDWSAPVPRCFAPCSDPGIPSSGSRTGDNFLHSSSVSFTCDQGFDLQGEKSITCTDGTWSNTRPRCKVVSCEDPGTPLHGYKKKVSGNYTYGGFIRFKCKTNYTLKGRSKLICQANKKWTYDKPTCLAPCPAPDHLLHGRIIGDNFQHGSVVRFECLDDHLLQGSPVRKCDDGEWNTTMPTCAACDGGFPLGMSSGAIPNSSIRASSQTDQHPAHHGRLGGNKYWCSRKERMSELRIDLPKKYKITVLTIEVQDPKDISVVALLGTILQNWCQFDAQQPAFRSGRSKILIKFPFISESLKILVFRRKESTVCLRAEVYGCDIPRDCIVPGSPVFASNDRNDGTFFKGYLTAKAGYLLEFLDQESKKITILPMERIFQNKKPEPVKLIKGTFVLVKGSRSNKVRKGEILLVKYPLYSVKVKGNVKKINASDILAVVRQAKLCSS